MTKLHGLVAEFLEPAEVLAAARGAHARGYRALEAYSPYPVEGLAEALGMKRTGVPPLALLGAGTGAALGYGMQWYAAVWDYPLNVGGRPLHSWPAFVPITFELTILCAALGSLIGMLALNRLPQLHHPIFETPFFEGRNAARFYLCVEATDPQFEREETRRFLRGFNPEHVWEVGDDQ